MIKLISTCRYCRHRSMARYCRKIKRRVRRNDSCLFYELCVGRDPVQITMTEIKVTCAWCGADMGTKDGQGQTGVSHSMCDKCKGQLMPESVKFNE